MDGVPTTHVWYTILNITTNQDNSETKTKTVTSNLWPRGIETKSYMSVPQYLKSSGGVRTVTSVEEGCCNRGSIHVVSDTLLGPPGPFVVLWTYTFDFLFVYFLEETYSLQYSRLTIEKYVWNETLNKLS